MVRRLVKQNPFAKYTISSALITNVEIGFLYKGGKIISSIEGLTAEEIKSLLWVKLPTTISLQRDLDEKDWNFKVSDSEEKAQVMLEQLSYMLEQSFKTLALDLQAGEWRQITANIRLCVDWV